MDGVMIVGNTNKLRIHKIRIDESPGDFQPCIVFEVHTDTEEKAHMAILEVSRDTRTMSCMERLYRTNFGCNCIDAIARLLVTAAVGFALLARGIFALLAFPAEEAHWSCTSMSSSMCHRRRYHRRHPTLKHGRGEKIRNGNGESQ